MAETSYTPTDEKIREYQGLLALNHMINAPATFNVLLDEDAADKWLEDTLIWLHSKKFVTISGDNRYIPTEQGRQVLQRFMVKYGEFLQLYDIFSMVDLEAGEFAFAMYFELDSDDWDEFKTQERWEDLRIAVAEFKKLDPFEIVFMSFLNEDRFQAGAGWPIDLSSGNIWAEIIKICDTAIKMNDLGYTDDDEDEISGESVLSDIITQGSQLNIDLIKKEEELENEEDEDEEERDGEDVVVTETTYYVEVVEEPVFGIDYYDSYLDPYYVSPIWLDPWYDPYY
jgi:hypothetical protein